LNPSTDFCFLYSRVHQNCSPKSVQSSPERESSVRISVVFHL
jgi:hypothetical protein